MPGTGQGSGAAAPPSEERWVAIREVGPRDGLQVEAPLPLEERVAMITALVEAGLGCLEVAAFVSPERVPSMAGAADVVRAVAEVPATCFALVPNLRGAQMALDAGVEAVSVTVSASEAYSMANVGKGRDEASAEVAGIIGLLAEPAVPVDVVVSCAFGYAGKEPSDLGWVEAQTQAWAGAGPCSLTLADTTGEAGPSAVEAAVERLGPDFGLHLHETRRTALATAQSALAAGIRRFDTSVAGLGGSPFAAGAAGNLATEDLVHFLGLAGYECDVRLEALLAVSRSMSDRLGRPPVPLSQSGPAAGYQGR